MERYYELRWQLLRAPWNQPRGSECDEWEDTAFHLQAEEPDGELIGIGRLHRCDNDSGQIRYMAVIERCRGRGVGKQLLTGLEQQARAWHLTTIQLHAREAAVGFYQHHGYRVIAPSHTLFGEIPHFHMQKRLQAQTR